jgi:hypothetical protein
MTTLKVLYNSRPGEQDRPIHAYYIRHFLAPHYPIEPTSEKYLHCIRVCEATFYTHLYATSPNPHALHRFCISDFLDILTYLGGSCTTLSFAVISSKSKERFASSNTSLSHSIQSYTSQLALSHSRGEL